MSGERVLEVLLNDVSVGELREEPHGKSTFRFSAEYLEALHRPVLSQSFLDNPYAIHEGKLFALPNFFSNLLPDPEGRLRPLIARQLGVKPNREFLLLSALGADLPGAVIIRPRKPFGIEGEDLSTADSEIVRPRTDQEVRFSLAGVQLKFSMIRRGKTLTYPLNGRGGDMIVKLPDLDFPNVPENEYSMMLWARACGIDVPEIELLPVDRLEGLPPEVAKMPGHAYAIQRFDRPKNGPRIHIEDMAQVFGLAPDEKYEQRHYQHIGRLLVQLPDRRGFEQFVRRLVFMLASGNSDAHLKNWSIIYRNGVRAELAPAYDFVSTCVYERTRSEIFALKLVRTRSYRDIDSTAFYAFAVKAGAEANAVVKLVEEMADQIRDEWLRLRKELPIPDAFKDAIEQHWQQVPLLHPRAS
ncbi:type II toxin-antitoxin system HipA family toxin [Archangium violaceum]|uniref:type II toxin-antitoxin system HipA family toxin n=1 Tax=Archangium violaceum TaxID=83451 RepID=UPI002B2AB96A|nr:type II toxin-antitoxin system HipA family toxin [Archangium violaceum]